MPTDEGSWDGRRPQKTLRAWLESSDGWIGPECGLPTGALTYLTGCGVGRLEIVDITRYVYDNLSYLICLCVSWAIDNQ